tara:strand:- start:86 stop:430 length:345 start_codon:yes stop_codon:yes gene_type:complete
MIVTAWNNGACSPSGAGYGFKIRKEDVFEHFIQSWDSVLLDLPGLEERIEVKIKKKSFWENCNELISKEIGKWLTSNNHAPWPKGHPPKFELTPTGNGGFKIELKNISTSRGDQ